MNDYLKLADEAVAYTRERHLIERLEQAVRELIKENQELRARLNNRNVPVVNPGLCTETTPDYEANNNNGQHWELYRVYMTTDFLKLADKAQHTLDLSRGVEVNDRVKPVLYSTVPTLISAVRELVAHFNSINSQHGDLLLDYATVCQERDEARAEADSYQRMYTKADAGWLECSQLLNQAHAEVERLKKEIEGLKNNLKA